MQPSNNTTLKGGFTQLRFQPEKALPDDAFSVVGKSLQRAFVSQYAAALAACVQFKCAFMNKAPFNSS